MKQGMLKFSKEFITPSGLKEWIGVEYPIDYDTEQPFEVLEQARVIAEGYQAKKSAEYEVYMNSPPQPLKSIPIEKIIPEDQRIEAIIADIYSCDELKVLESYRLLAKKEPALQAAYDNMLKKL